MSEQIDDGGSAFPCEGGNDSGLHSNPGMSLRDWFAGKALAAIIAKAPYQVNQSSSREEALEDPMLRFAANGAYLYADAMLAARSAGRAQS